MERFNAVRALTVAFCMLVLPTTLLAQATSEEAGFLRGDPNCDGRVDISDPLSVFSNLFLGFGKVCCTAAADADTNSLVDLSDGIYLLNYLALGGTPPAAPFPECAVSGANSLPCENEPCPATEGARSEFTLYGKTFEADSVVIAIGRSGSMGVRTARLRIAAEIQAELATLPPDLPFDIVYYDGEQTRTLSSTGAPSVVLSTARETTNNALDEVFARRSSGDDMKALFATAITCARRGAGEQAVIYIGDGWDLSFGPTNFAEVDPGLLKSVSRSIWRDNRADSIVPIHVIGIHSYSQSSDRLMHGLARDNEGTYTSAGDVVAPPNPRDC